MTAARPSLLPQGLSDTLPPTAAREAGIVEALIGRFAGHGYDRVKPPLVEFEETLFTGVGARLARDTFRLMDPSSQAPMGLRADLTPQIARIASTRLAKAPRPLRLAYAGEVMRVRGEMLRPERQFAQVGAELIGGAEPTADAEIALLALDGLAALGIQGLSIDLTIPQLVDLVVGGTPLDPDTRAALDRKDRTALATEGGPCAPALLGLLDATGPAARALDRLARLDLPTPAQAEIDHLARIVDLITRARPGQTATVDLVDRRGAEYHAGVSFTLFALGVRGELGGGGRYGTSTAGHGAPGEIGETAVGVTLYLDSVLRATPSPPPPRRLYLPTGHDAPAAETARNAGWVTVAALAPADDPAAEARRLGCAALLSGAEITPLS